MWYGTDHQTCEDYEITNDIENEISKIVNSDEFEFAWYIYLIILITI
jgi:hypothetical protein